MISQYDHVLRRNYIRQKNNFKQIEEHRKINHPFGNRFVHLFKDIVMTKIE